jgi:hypothetical protein
MAKWCEFYVDKEQPGIVRGGPFDSMGGMLVGMHAKEVCDRLNNYSRLQAQLEAVPPLCFHHPDCNYWKWDWRFSWHKSDCNCIEVSGPTEPKAAIGESDETHTD